MHFVTEKYDEGPLFFSQSVPILPDDTVETLAKRVNEAEHKWQPIITQKVLSNQISWNGKNPNSLKGAILN
jgi:phosphoribosylglycinamide formyltransferase-1